MTSIHETKSCPRCRSAFQCKPANISQCQCYGIALDDTERSAVSEQYTDCLCRDCLLEIKQELKNAPRAEAIKKMQSFFQSR